MAVSVSGSALLAPSFIPVLINTSRLWREIS
jgi:hypothetical protein